MNLFDMLRRKDPNLTISSGIVPVKREFFGRTYRALRMSKGSSVRISTPRRFLPFSRHATTIGWLAVADDDGARLRVIYEGVTSAKSLDLKVGPFPCEIVFPIPLSSAPEPRRAYVELKASKGAIDLLVNEVFDRRALLGRCIGTGIELGPGHQPQVLPSRSVDVRYVEEKSIESWASTYDAKGSLKIDPQLWDRYTIGTATNLPADSASLDFVFSSHVLEHIVNPLNALQHWSQKLRARGIVACVVPDAMGCKDYVFTLSNPHAWEFEYASGAHCPTREHFVRYVNGRGMPMERVDAMITTGFSIHVHFYSRENIVFLLQSCVDRGWFSGYELDFRSNNKDFHFVLTK